MRTCFVVWAALAGMAAGASVPTAAQLPFAAVKASGQAVTPAFEGWYKNPDGSFSLSFGYYNRNAEEVLDVPVGRDNRVEPGPENQGQPTEFQPGRHWGVFAVKVPADFGNKTLTWTVSIRGTTYAIPGYLRPSWEIDALAGEAGSGNTPPVLRFAAAGPEGAGPLGITSGPVTATAGTPLTITVWAKDDGRGATAGRGGPASVTLAWFKHQGPGRVTFAPATGRAAATGAEATTAATFSQAGSYLVRVRANDASGVANAGHAQCCWSNGFLKVTVK
jgi:hypothetical protein